jgi:hypothetical protein
LRGTTKRAEEVKKDTEEERKRDNGLRRKTQWKDYKGKCTNKNKGEGGGCK